MNLSGDIVWESHYYKQLTSGLTTSLNNFIVDYARKRIYISYTINNINNDERILIQLFDFNMNKLGEWQSPVGIYVPLRALRFTLNEDGSRILMASATGAPFAPMPGYLEINFSDFSNSVLVSTSFDLGLLYSNSGEGAYILGENKGKMYIARDGGGAFFVQRKIQFQSVDYPSFSSSDGIIYDTGINGSILFTYKFNKSKNELETLVVLSDETTVEFWTFNFDTLTLTRSSNNLQNYADNRSGAVYLLSTGNLLRIAWWDINDNSVKVGYFDRNMNLISIEGKLFINAQRPGTSAGNLNVIVPLDAKGNQLSFFHYQQNYWRTLPQQSTKSLPLFSGDSNGTNQTTKDKPLGRNRPHIVEINTANSGVTTNTQFQTTGMVGDYDVKYDNKQGISGVISNLNGEQILTFPQEDVYELHFYGKSNFQGFRFANSGDRNKLTKILQWGDNVNYRDRTGAFYNCRLLTEVNTPDGVVINGLSPFRQCVSLSTFSVAEMILFDRVQHTFRETNCDVDTTKLKFSAVTGNGIVEMFQLSKVGNIKLTSNIQSSEVTLARAFASMGGNADTIDISILKRKKITNLQDAFAINSGLEKIIGIEYLNTSICSSFYQTFINTPSLEDMDLSRWNTSSATTMQNMFNSCGADPGDISNWNISNVTDMSNFFSSASKGITSSVYTQCLIKWSQLPLQSGVQLDMTSIKYDASAQTAKDYIINTFGWTINDGGQL